MTRVRFGAAFAVMCALLTAAPQAQMPDVRQMSGIPLPLANMAAGTVSVRVVRDALTNPVTNHPVQLVGDGEPKTAATNESGRAEFTGLTAGAQLRAQTTVDGQLIESQPFEVPRTGGVRLMLVALTSGASAAPDPGAAQAPVQPGLVTLGSESRLVIELGQDGLNVFNIFQIVNRLATPVQPPAPLVFDLPDTAEHASILEGSSPLAVLAGKRVTVAGPFPPGPTLVQFAYTIEFGRSQLTLSQQLPADLAQLTVIVQKMGAMHVTSPQFAQHREMKAQGGTYIFAQGGALRAGDAIALNFTGLPHQPMWPRNVALALAVLILGAGLWVGLRARPGDDGIRRLQAERDRMFEELTRLEQEHRSDGVDAEYYATRRRELIASLERVYGQLDEEAAA